MAVNNIEIIKEIGEQIKIKEYKTIEIVDNAVSYTLENVKLDLEEKLYKEYVDSIYQILNCINRNNSLSWWKLTNLVKLQSLSRTTDNIIAEELKVRYKSVRDTAIKYANLSELESMISSLPPITSDEFGLAFYQFKKSKSDLPKDFFDSIEAILLINRANLELDLNYGLNKEKSKK